jgi:hypothetical protein
MQMQPINPLGSMVVEAKETRAAEGKGSTDPLFSSLTGSLPANTRKFAVTGGNVEKFASKPPPGERRHKDTTESSGLTEQTETFSTSTATDADRLEDVSDRRHRGKTAGEQPADPAVPTTEGFGTVPSQQKAETTPQRLREHAEPSPTASGTALHVAEQLSMQPAENPPASDPEVASAAILDTIAQGGKEKKQTAMVDPSQAKGPKRTEPEAGALSDLVHRPAMSRSRNTAQQETSSLSALPLIAGLGQKTDDAGTQGSKPAGPVPANTDPAALKVLGDEGSIILSETARQQQEAGISLPQAEGRLPPGISQTSVFHVPLPNGGEILSSIGSESKFSVLDLHLIEFQNKEIQQTIPAAAGDSAKTLQQAGTLLDAQFTAILGRPLDGLAEATTPFPLRQRLHSALPEVSVAGADNGGATPGNLVLKMSAPLQPDDEGQKRFGKNHAWFSTNTLLHQGQPGLTITELQAEFHHTLGVSRETTTSSVTAQDISTARLPSGLFVPESQIIDHVIRQMTFNTTRNSHTISIKMHPEELGSLKMDLAHNEHGIRAHIQVQSQQVQDILEKYLFRLKDSFEQQGLTLDSIQVSVNSGKNGSPTLFSEQHPHAHSKTSTTATIHEASKNIAEEMVILQHGHEGYINLRI